MLTDGIPLFIYSNEGERKWLQRAFGPNITTIKVEGLASGYRASALIAMPSVDTESQWFREVAHARLSLGNAGVIRLSPGW